MDKNQTYCCENWIKVCVKTWDGLTMDYGFYSVSPGESEDQVVAGMRDYFDLDDSYVHEIVRKPCGVASRRAIFRRKDGWKGAHF